MQLPEFIKKALAFFEKWEANLTASAEKLATALVKVADLEKVVTAKDGEIATLKAAKDAAENDLKATKEKLSNTETSLKTLEARNKELENKEQDIGKRAGQKAAQTIATQAAEPVEIDPKELPAKINEKPKTYTEKCLAANAKKKA